MSRWDRSDAFWAKTLGGVSVRFHDRTGEVVIRDGFRFVWAINALGTAYLKSLGQVGYEHAPRYTLQQYLVQAQEMAEEHARNLPPEARNAVGRQIVMEQMMAPMNMPGPSFYDDTPPSGACFIE